MKKILLLLLLIARFSNAQTVNIPDANFKAKLLSANSSNAVAAGNYEGSIVLDSNNDGEIQVSEALAVRILNISNASISSLNGIEFFQNLLGLNCSNNLLTTLSLQNLCNLNYIDCSHNLLTTLNYCESQYYEGGFDLSYNSFVEINLSEFNHPMGSSGTLNVSNNPNLVYLNIKNGSDFNSCDPTYYPNNPDCLGELNIENCLQLEFVCVDENSEELGLVEFKVNEMGITEQVQITTDCSLYSPLGISNFTQVDSVAIVPNPAKDNVIINCDNNIKTIELFDVQGRFLSTQIVNTSQTLIDISNYTNGIYFIKVTTEKGSKVEKIIKE